MNRIGRVAFPGIKKVVEEPCGSFSRCGSAGLKKKRSTFGLLDGLKLLLNEDMTPEM